MIEAAAPNADEILTIAPEIALAAGALVMLLIGVFAKNGGKLVTMLSLLLVAGAAIALFFIPLSEPVFNGAFILDPFARFMKIATLIASGIAILLAVGHGRRENFERFEYPILIITASLGMMVMISAHDMIALYIGIELQSLSLYVLAAIKRDSVKSTEAGIKYFVLGAMSSGLLLYGISLVYGFTGQTSFYGIAAALTDGADTGLIFGLVFILAGLAFKVSAVPFHMWTPDVYQGAPTPVTAFFAAAPKLAAVALLVRVVSEPFGNVADQWQQILTFLAIASMVLGAFAAIGQTQHQAPDGLFGDRPCRLCAGRPCRRNRGGRPRCHHLPCHLSGDDGRHFRLHPFDADVRRHGREHLRSRRHLPDQSGHGDRAGNHDVLAGGYPATRGLLRQVLCLLGGDRSGALPACGDRRSRQRRRRLLLSPRRQGDVLRRGR